MELDYPAVNRATGKYYISYDGRGGKTTIKDMRFGPNGKIIFQNHTVQTDLLEGFYEGMSNSSIDFEIDELLRRQGQSIIV